MIFQYNSANIFYTDRGKGPSVVLLHGFLLHSGFWEPLVNELVSEHRVVTVDLPGHGQSDLLGKVHTMELMAEVVHGLLTHLGIPTAVFIGHSMGGYVSLAILESHKATVDGIVLLNSTTKADGPERVRNRERALKIIPKNPNSFINMALRNLFAEYHADHFSEDLKILQAEASRFPVEGILAMTRGMKQRTDRTWVLKDFKGPKLIVCGSEDPIISLSESKAVAENTQSELKIVEGGHMILLENWSEFVKIVRFIDFL